MTQTPTSTIRLQLHKNFNFDDATATIAYYASLGISHFYTSPILTARPGSMHGYDIVDPTQINPELGGEAGFKRMVAKLREANMGLIVDIVPNHMGVGGENPWWVHVLEYGRESPYADWFDIDWRSNDPTLQDKIMLPVLGDHYGKVLHDGELRLQFSASKDKGKHQAKFVLTYYQQQLPIRPYDYVEILSKSDAAILKRAIELAKNISLMHTQHRHDAQFEASALDEGIAHLYSVLGELAQTEDGARAINDAMAFFSASTSNVKALHALLERQHYRLAWWRCAADQLNWRRFFEVSELIGMRVERDDVFEASHALIFRLYQEGLIDGLRVDHIDGLVDPKSYCRKLHARLEELSRIRPDHPRPYIVVEKILAADEHLRTDWQIDGTTGYDFMDQVSAVLHDPKGAPVLDELWAELHAGEQDSFEDEVRAARHQLLRENLSGEFEATARALLAVARSEICTRDYSIAAIRRVLLQLLLYFPVYRTYVDGASCAEDCATEDKAIMQRCADEARLHLRSGDHALLDQVVQWLSATRASDGSVDPKRLHAVTHFQQLTPPLSAKSVEDTAFYRYGRLLSRNEVGANPAQLSLTVNEFHATCLHRAANFSRAMLATATHDHKRGEDLRARLAVLSEVPQQWEQQVRQWMRLHQPQTPAPQPSSADQYMLYQMIVGAWPLTLTPDDADGMAELARRLSQWQSKAIREAKQTSDWIAPDTEYEQACENFLQQIFTPERSPQHSTTQQSFLHQLINWVHQIAPTGQINSMTQTLLRMTVPGIPDLYQASEREDLTLVDPDNRRPNDYVVRRECSGSQAIDADAAFSDRKQHLIATVLKLRAQMPRVFTEGGYVPLEVGGRFADKVIAFLRVLENQSALVIATRHMHGFDPSDWSDTTLTLPVHAEHEWRSVLSERRLRAQERQISVGELLSGRTVEVYVNTGE
jgi:(1->4)-alpha-D-glucan 1-alpha-D-glucosylmutase